MGISKIFPRSWSILSCRLFGILWINGSHKRVMKISQTSNRPLIGELAQPIHRKNNIPVLVKAAAIKISGNMGLFLLTFIDPSWHFDKSTQQEKPNTRKPVPISFLSLVRQIERDLNQYIPSATQIDPVVHSHLPEFAA